MQIILTEDEYNTLKKTGDAETRAREIAEDYRKRLADSVWKYLQRHSISLSHNTDIQSFRAAFSSVPLSAAFSSVPLIDESGPSKK